MTASKTRHAIFTIERTFKAPPKRVFAAWATPEGKAAWFGGPAGDSVEEIREFNFREGGKISAYKKGEQDLTDAAHAHAVANGFLVKPKAESKEPVGEK